MFVGKLDPLFSSLHPCMEASSSSVCRQNSQAFSLKKSLGITLSGVLLQLYGCKLIFEPVVTHVEKVSSNEMKWYHYNRPYYVFIFSSRVSKL